jgi:hypothetical protein
MVGRVLLLLLLGAQPQWPQGLPLQQPQEAAHLQNPQGLLQLGPGQQVLLVRPRVQEQQPQIQRAAAAQPARVQAQQPQQ